jgi:glycogen operon protein
VSNEIFELLPSRIGAPQGASLDEEGCNFVVCSPEATEVFLCLFDQNEQEIKRFKIIERNGPYWCCYVKGVKAGQYYAFRTNGSNNQSSGNSFDVTKLLIDPYARLLNKPQSWSYERYCNDNEKFISKSVVTADDFDWEGVTKPDINESNAILYELHVRGYTKLNPHVPEKLRGTYLGLCDPSVISHIKNLGITAIQLMPVHAHMDESRLVDMKLCNYWGYNTINFFAPEPSYASDPLNAVNEFKQMVKTMHQNGIAVIMDVVYNHTAEGGYGGPIISFRGLDNKNFYMYEKNSSGHKMYNAYTNCSGCGNTVNVDHPDTLKLVIDSLHYWANEMQVDGFRFDLATSLAREESANGYTPNAAFFKVIAIDPVLSKCLLIAEPWDIGGYGYRVGQFPNSWKELNDHYRDTIRSFWKGDDGKMAEFATRILGSRDLYPKTLRSIHSSVNFITYHDGFTLHDVVSYNNRHNEANCENNQDGHGQNLSYNYGEEGPTANVHINNRRELQKRNMLTTLMLSQGIPHIVAGDEMGRSQMGNNNAYCQDNRISWVNWDLSDDDKDLLKFTSKLIRLRLGSTLFTNLKLPDDNYFGKIKPEHQVLWYHADGHQLTADDWNNPQSRLFTLDIGEISNRGERWLVLFNASRFDIGFHLPVPGYGMLWEPVLDTAEPDGHPYENCSRPSDLSLTRSLSIKVLHQIVNTNPEVTKQYRHHPGTKIRIGINGFGRVGRGLLREALQRTDVEVCGINDPVAGDASGNVTREGIEYLVYMLRHDSVHGCDDHRIEINGHNIVINGRALRVTARHYPSEINWDEIGAEVVMEASGRFNNQSLAAAHLKAGAIKVIITATPDDDTPVYMMGINEKNYSGADVMSTGSSTANCLVPLIEILNTRFGVSSALATAVLPYSAEQKTVDGPFPSEWRKGRGAAQNIIPLGSDMSHALDSVMPDSEIRFNGIAMSVPVADVALLDLTVNLKTDATYEEVCGAVAMAAEGEFSGKVKYIRDPVVSSDILGEKAKCCFDASAGAHIGSRLFKLVAWYDNEFSYARNLLDLSSFIMNQ